MATFNAPELRLAQLVILLLGEKESGKSSAGNTILGRRAFHTNTTRSSKESSTVFGIQVTVADTPGWSPHSTAPGTASLELCRGLNLCHPEPHVILLLLPACSSFGQQQWEAMESQLRMFQVPIWERAMVLFTHGDKIGGLPIQQHIRQQGRTLHWLLERCGNRYHVMTNQPSASQAQVTDLFRKIQRMMEFKKLLVEIERRMYSQLGRDLSMKTELRRQAKENNLRVPQDAPDGHQGRWMQMNSGRACTPRGLPEGTAGVKPALSLVLLGRRKSGKSSAGNFILGREEFLSNVKTIKSTAAYGEVSGQPVTVVDTPGWSLFGLAKAEQVREEIRRSPSLCPVASKAVFLLAVPVDSFSKRERGAMEAYLSVLGEQVWRQAMVLFTYGEELRGKTVESHIKKKGVPLQWLLDKCGHRYHVLDMSTGDHSQANQLLEMVEQL